VRSLDNNKKCLTIFVDIKKAFDTVSIPLLIIKLEKMGIRGNQLSLFKDYLSFRTQRVKIDTRFSDEQFITYGIPQGSIIGPTLFLCYINDLYQLKLKNCRITSYADDTALTFFGDDWDEVFGLAQEGFNTVTHWLARNVLTLNSDKTKYMVYTIRDTMALNVTNYNIYAHMCSYPPLNLCSSCPTINKVNSIKYLGITLDKNLSFNHHIHKIAQRTRKLLYVFKQLRHGADARTLKNVYLTLSLSIVTYCLTSWGGAAKSKLIELERAQRLILKVCLFKPRLFPTATLYQEAEVLTVRQLFILLTILRKHSQINYERDKLKTARRSYNV
jgi:hypothetical protein